MKRATITSCRSSYEVVTNVKRAEQEQEKSKGEMKKSGIKGFTLFRYGLCGVILLICFLGKLLSFSPVTEASNFIKDELNRDYLAEIQRLLDDR